MLWLNPIALFALAAVAAPILIHLLIQRRAERFLFPTLRFLQPTRLAAIRRHLLDDLSLVAVRVAVIAAAAAALAGPLVVTSATRQAWDRRVVRAIVTDTVRVAGTEVAPHPAEAPGSPAEAVEARTPPAPGASSPRAEQAAVLRQETFAAGPLADGIQRAILWLDTAPPARREIVVASTFAIGSITQADVAAIPAGIGVRFERSGTLPSTRTVPAGRLLTTTGVRAREVTVTGDRTSSRDVATSDATAWPIDVVVSHDDQRAVDAAIAAVLSQRVWAAPPDRRARLVLTSDVVQASRPATIEGLADAGLIRQPWMANAAARIARDPDLRAAAVGVAVGLSDARFAAAPWQILAAAADGHPLAAAAGSTTRLIVASAAASTDVATPVLLRSIANAIADVPDLRGAEVVTIADPVLRGWTRPAAPVSSPRIDVVDRDDRRWLWLAALCLLGLETGIRRARSSDVSQARNGEHARVA